MQKNEQFGQKYVGIDTNFVRFCWRTCNFCYRAIIWLDHFKKIEMGQKLREWLSTKKISNRPKISPVVFLPAQKHHLRTPSFSHIFIFPVQYYRWSVMKGKKKFFHFMCPLTGYDITSDPTKPLSDISYTLSY